MMAKAVQRVVTTVAVVLVGFCSSFSQSNQSSGSLSSEINAKPLLRKRVKENCVLGAFTLRPAFPRPHSSAQGQPEKQRSRHLVAGTEDLAPGATLP
jgi:hypothetical protein